MVTPVKNHWQDAVKSFANIEEFNEETIYNLQQLIKQNPSLGESDDIIAVLRTRYPELFMDLPACPDVPNTLARTSFLQNQDLNNFVEQSFNRIKELDKFQSTLLQEEKPFSDIVLNGPQNTGEVALLQAATQFLEPQEFREAVNSKLSIGSTIEKIGASKVRREVTKTLITFHLEWMAKQDVSKPKLCEELGNYLNQSTGLFVETNKAISSEIRKNFAEEVHSSISALPAQNPEDVGRSR